MCLFSLDVPLAPFQRIHARLSRTWAQNWAQRSVSVCKPSPCLGLTSGRIGTPRVRVPETPHKELLAIGTTGVLEVADFAGEIAGIDVTQPRRPANLRRTRCIPDHQQISSSQGAGKHKGPGILCPRAFVLRSLMERRDHSLMGEV